MMHRTTSFLPALVVTLMVTASGQAEVFDIRPGPESSAPNALVASGSLGQDLFFFADDGETGREPWQWRGDDNVLAQVADLEVGGGSSARGSVIRSLGARAIFVAAVSGQGQALWSASSEETGARRLSDFIGGFEDLDPAFDLASAMTIGDRLIVADVEGGLHSIDGRLEGSLRLIPGVPVFGTSAERAEAVALGDRVLVTDREGQLWSIDPVTGNAVALLPGDDRLSVSSSRTLVATARAAAFQLDGGDEVWVSDGTMAGTGFLALDDARTFTSIRSATAERLILSRELPRGPNLEDGFDVEIWQSDGSPAGTERLGQIGPFADGLRSFDFDDRGEHLFIVRTTTGPISVTPTSALWSHSMDAGIRVLRESSFSELRMIPSPPGGSDQAYVADVYAGNIWGTDGTPEGTQKLIGDGERFAVTPNIQVGDRLFVSFNRRTFITDGTPDGTQLLVTNFDAVIFDSLFDEAYIADDTLFWGAQDNDNNVQFLRSDGTAEGTESLSLALPGETPFDPRELTLADNRFFFAANTPAGRELVSEPRGLVTVPRLALQEDDRFDIIVAWQKPNGETGFGSPTRLTEDTGHFFFFRDSNLELMIKVLDGRQENGHFWVFYGSLSNVAFTIHVTDQVSGQTKTYENPQGTFASVGDTRAIAAPVDSSAGVSVPNRRVATEPPRAPVAGAFRERSNPFAEGCRTGPESLCLQQSRFIVEAVWETPNGETGRGKAMALTGDTGAFYFFRETNLELMVKVLDGRDINDHFWVFYGALSNVRYELVVTDTETGAERRYVNPQGRFGSVGDTRAFAVP